MDISRTHLVEDLNSSMEGQDVIFGGWVVDLRKLGKMAFLTVRDVTGMCQVIVKGDSMNLLEGLNRQSVVRILGKIQTSKVTLKQCEWSYPKKSCFCCQYFLLNFFPYLFNSIQYLNLMLLFLLLTH